MDKNCWDLGAMYAAPELWEEDFKKLPLLADKYYAYRGRLAESAAALKEAIEAGDELSRLGEKVYCYAHLKSDEDTSNNANRERVDRVGALFAELSDKEAWFDPELMAISDERMKELLDAPELSFYRRSIEELLRDKPHILSEKEETLLGNYSAVLGSSGKTFGILNDADLDFGTVKNSDGKREKLTHGSYRRFMECPDRSVRKAAFDKLYKVYGAFRNTFASTLNATVQLHATGVRVRNYKSSLAAALSGDNVPESVYRNLISSVHANFPAFYDYMKLRREVMGLEKLDMYDMYNPLVSECRCDYTFEQAKELVRASLAPMGKEYIRDIELAFSQRWVDVPERKGKRSGAYSGGCYDSYPYMLLNYNGTLNDVFTLTHELGHSMHSFYSNKNCHYHYADYRIFVAEVASTTNEILLFEYLYENAASSELRKYLLCHLADEIRGTIFRQTMFAEFELWMHEAVESGMPLSADTLSKKYYELNALYYGNEVEPSKAIELEWARIPHFYYNFYVYKYATGMSAALQLAKNLRSGDEAKRKAYIGFLSAGCTKDVLDIMRDAGVDLETPEPVDAALSYFADLVQRMRKEFGK
ncbi:MAG: oligoendopeptidase F [Lentisphaeria bacterium]|nr:oligoendopeptidase F [Lentisphaeria bacterium]MBO5766526.1 oligoendopeptidase F [Lentisphaeria bacterium]